MCIVGNCLCYNLTISLLFILNVLNPLHARVTEKMVLIWSSIRKACVCLASSFMSVLMINLSLVPGVPGTLLSTLWACIVTVHVRVYKLNGASFELHSSCIYVRVLHHHSLMGVIYLSSLLMKLNNLYLVISD